MRDYQDGEFGCLDPEALVGYVYDEGEPGDRAAIDAHVAICARCAAEVASLRDTRTTLATWMPPETPLGFQISRPAVLTPARWWSRPLPAWAQAAAAVAIFASGVGFGVANRRTAPVTVPATVTQAAPAAAATTTAAATISPAATPAAVTANAAPDTVSRQELDRVAQQLRAEMVRLRTVAAPAPRADDQVLKEVRAMIAESEQRQQRAAAIQTAQVVRQLDAERRVDLAQMQRAVGQIQDFTGAAVRDQNQLVNYLVNVSQRR